MKNIDELRRALDAETADVAVHLPADAIRRRARGIRTRRAAAISGATVFAVAALAVPVALAGGGPGASHEVGGQLPLATACPSESTGTEGKDGAGSAPFSLGPVVGTGVTLEAPDVGSRYEVVLALTGTRDDPGFVIGFRDPNAGVVEPWDTTVLARDQNGDFPGKYPGDPSFQFYSGQLALGPNRVLDVGLYTRAADRITVASEGRATEARTERNAAIGWTFFSVERTARPLPPDANTTPEEYQGPERLTITAYDAAGHVQHSVTGGFHLGHSVQNPRDHQPVDDPTTPTSCGSPGIAK
jgi:hypothetical protein